MQQVKSKGFQCKADRAKDAAMEKHYGSIGIKSVEAAQTLCKKSQSMKMPKAFSMHTLSKSN